MKKHALEGKGEKSENRYADMSRRCKETEIISDNLMPRLLLISWLLFPVFAHAPLTPYVKYMDTSLQELVVLCLNGGKASLWSEGKSFGFIECKRIAYPKRLPR